MSDKEFVQWFRGFVEGAHHYNITPKQWDDLKDKLSLVKKEGPSSFAYQLDKSWVTDIAY